MVGQSQIPPNLFQAYPDTGISLSGVRLVGQQGAIRTRPQASLLLCRLRVQPERVQGQTHPRGVADPEYKNPETSLRTNMPDMRPIQ